MMHIRTIAWVLATAAATQTTPLLANDGQQDMALNLNLNMVLAHDDRPELFDRLRNERDDQRLRYDRYYRDQPRYHEYYPWRGERYAPSQRFYQEEPEENVEGICPFVEKPA